jgi:RNA polymerase primary sigma factor
MLSELSPRAHEVIVNRFGLGDDAQSKTLEAIGQKYGITRERVRQIENTALALIRKSEFLKTRNLFLKN